jgi:hypothetical protein
VPYQDLCTALAFSSSSGTLLKTPERPWRGAPDLALLIQLRADQGRYRGRSCQAAFEDIRAVREVAEMLRPRS